MKWNERNSTAVHLENGEEYPEQRCLIKNGSPRFALFDIENKQKAADEGTDIKQKPQKDVLRNVAPKSWHRMLANETWIPNCHCDFEF